MNCKQLSMAAALMIAGGLLIAQAVPIARSNPPVEGDLVAPPLIASLLRGACYDCHSNETRWPWYTHVAPISWWAVHDVELGRKEINFSRWNSYRPLVRQRKLEWIGTAMHEAGMPTLAYRLVHPDARLSDADRRAIAQWADSQLSDSHKSKSRDQGSK